MLERGIGVVYKRSKKSKDDSEGIVGFNFFKAEDGKRWIVRFGGLGDV